MSKKIIAIVTATFLVGWLLLVLLSWLLSATMVPGVRSLLTGEGLRWFFAHLVDSLASPLLVWLLMAAMAGGCLVRSGLFLSLSSSSPSVSSSSSPRVRSRALRLSLLVLLVYVAFLALLTVVPHAVLLSSTGTLSHSPFSRAIVPVVAAAVILFSTVYGLATHAFASLADITEAMVIGLEKSAPLFFVYIVAMVFIHTMSYVF